MSLTSSNARSRGSICISSLYALVTTFWYPAMITAVSKKTLLSIPLINPKAKIHVLAIPKTPNVDFADFVSKNDQDTVSGFFKKIDHVIEKLGVKNDGYRLVSNSGINGCQEVPHFHIHILGGEKIGSLR